MIEEYKGCGDYCRICRKKLENGDLVGDVKPKYGPKFYVHADCVKKRGEPSRD
jgi:hypothetical protein